MEAFGKSGMNFVRWKMTNNTIFQCVLCKKFKNQGHLEHGFNDGSLMCKECGDDIRGAFKYYIGEKEVSQDEYNKLTRED